MIIVFFVSLFAHSTVEMVNNVAIGSIPVNIYDPSFKQQERNNGVFGTGLGVTDILVIHLGGSRMFFQRDWVGRRGGGS